MARNDEYRLIADFVRRELVFSEVRQKLVELGATGDDWNTIASLLDRLGARTSDELCTGKPETGELTLQTIEEEFGLTKKQVRMLHRFYGFPRPTRKRDGFRFGRADVERWIAEQPVPSQPAAILKRKKQRIAVNSKAAAVLRAQYGDGSWPRARNWAD